MYYEEKLIDGILHWRGTPDGEWQIIPAEKLGERVIAAEAFRAAVAAALAELQGTIAAHDVRLESCDRDGNEYCDCLERAIARLNAEVAI